jgi:hypothetical protein
MLTRKGKMTTTLRASTFKSLAFVLIMLAVVVFCILVLFLPSRRYDAFPAEERIAQNIEQAAYGTQYKHSQICRFARRPPCRGRNVTSQDADGVT